MKSPSLYQQVMGADFDRLPASLQQFHAFTGKHVLSGWAEVGSPASFPARFLAWCLGAPLKTQKGPIRFELRAAAACEVWTRHFSDKTMESRLTLVRGHIEERLGAARLGFALKVSPEKLEMQLVRLHFLGVPATLAPARHRRRGNSDRRASAFPDSSLAPNGGRGHQLPRPSRTARGRVFMIVVFDAQCLLCSRWVKFLLKYDRRALLRFASIQGEAGQALLAQAGLRVDGLQTLLLVNGTRSWQHTGAIIRVLHALGWPWRAAWLAWPISGPVRDAIYRLIARNRYSLFGRSETCLKDPADYTARFLD